VTTDKVIPLHPPQSELDQQWAALERQQQQIREQLEKILEQKK
tara:strand:+ start:144 stop:272 length:129 start_codon:yes stop_codon:yes gene_type:complete